MGAGGDQGEEGGFGEGAVVGFDGAGEAFEGVAEAQVEGGDGFGDGVGGGFVEGVEFIAELFDLFFALGDLLGLFVEGGALGLDVFFELGAGYGLLILECAAF